MPETSARFFPPSLEDAYTLRVAHRNIFVGEDDLAALVGKWPQAHKGMGKRWHHMPLHHCGRERWYGRERSRSNGAYWKTIGYLNPDGWSPGVKIGNVSAGSKVEATGT